MRDCFVGSFIAVFGFVVRLEIVMWVCLDGSLIVSFTARNRLEAWRKKISPITGIKYSLLA